MELRKVIEPALAGFAAERADEEDIKELRLHCERMAEEQNDIESFIDDDNQFHLRVAAFDLGHEVFDDFLLF